MTVGVRELGRGAAGHVDPAGQKLWLGGTGHFFQSMSRGPNRAGWKKVRDCPAGKVYPPGKKVLPGEAGKDLLE
jgi:hypothetical protein